MLTAHVSAEYIMSEAFSSNEMCNTVRIENNKKFPKYTRSNCFENNKSFQYSLCAVGEKCYKVGEEKNDMILIHPTTQKKLDSIIDVLEKKQSSLTEAQYNSMIENFETQLSKFSEKQQDNPNAMRALVYLADEVKTLQSEQNTHCPAGSIVMPGTKNTYQYLDIKDGGSFFANTTISG